MWQAKIIKHKIKLLEFRGKTTNNNYSNISKNFLKDLKVAVKNDSEEIKKQYLNKIQLKTVNFFKNKHIELDKRKYSITIDLTSKVIDPEQKYPFIYHISAHSDDLCGIANFLKNQAAAGSSIYSQIISDDYIGINISDGIMIIHKLLETLGNTCQEITAANIQSILGNHRAKEHLEACKFLKIAPDIPDIFDKLDLKNFKPLEIVIDPQGKIHSYISKFEEISAEKKQKLRSRFETAIGEANFENKKTLLILPYIYDYHPVHQKIAELFLEFYLELPTEHQKNIEIWLQPTGDVLNNFTTNIYYPYEDFVFKHKLWNVFQSQINRNPLYPFYSRTIDIINALQINSHYQYAEKFLKIEINK